MRASLSASPSYTDVVSTCAGQRGSTGVSSATDDWNDEFIANG